MDSLYIWTLLIGLIIISYGCLMWKKSALFLVVGYKKSSFNGNKERLAKRTGLIFIILGFATLSIPINIKILGDIAWLLYVLDIIICYSLVMFLIKRNR